MAITSYSTLITAINNRSGRDDIAVMVDDFITLAEEKIWSKVRVREMEDTASLTSTTRLVALPAGYLEARRVTPYYQSNYYKELVPKSLNALNVLDEEGIPRNYSITATMEVDRIPLGTLEMNYFKKLTGLSPTNADNAVFLAFPSLYFFGALAELYSFSEDIEQESKYRTLFEKSVMEANSAYRNSLGAGLVIQVEGCTP